MRDIKGHGVKAGLEARDLDLKTLRPGTRDPGPTSKFKSGTLGATPLGEFICGLRGMTYTRKSLNVRNRKSRNIPSFLLSYS